MGYELPQEKDYKEINQKTLNFAGNTTAHLKIGEGHQNKNKNRVSSISRIFGTHTQIGFCNDNVLKTNDNNTFDFDSNWNKRKFDKNNLKDTKDRIFTHKSLTRKEQQTPKIERLTNLALRDNGYKNYNILNNTITNFYPSKSQKASL